MRRMISDTLQKYLKQVKETYPDPTDIGGSNYTAGTGIDITNNEISIDNTVALKSELNQYLKDNDLNYSGTFRGNGVYVKAEGTYTATSYADGSIGRSIPNQPGYTYTMPNKSGTFAMTDDVITSYDDLTNKPDLSVYELKSEAFSGDYDDLTNKPDLSVYELKEEAFSGDYNDLTNQPAIPDAVSGTNDGTNWTTLTIGNDTYGVGGGSAPSNMVTTDTAQTITGTKTFAHTPASITDAGIKIDMYSDDREKVGVEFITNDNDTASTQNWCLSAFNGDLRIRQISGTGNFTFSNHGIIPNNINSANLGDSDNR